MPKSIINCAATLLALSAAVAVAQPPAFEVASVKPATTRPAGMGVCMVPCSGERVAVVGARVDIRWISIEQLILTAYRLKPYQLSAPDWARNERFDIAAKMPEGATRQKLPEMLQALLAERFHLAIHRETKEQPVYALVVGKGGIKLRETSAEAEAPLPEDPAHREVYTPDGDARILGDGGFVTTGGLLGPMRGGRGSTGGMKVEFFKLAMPGLAALLTPHSDHPVMDETGLKGVYYFAAENRPQGPMGESGGRKGLAPEGGPQGLSQGEDLFGDALRASLAKGGLTLDTRKLPIERVIVDHVDKAPSAN